MKIIRMDAPNDRVTDVLVNICLKYLSREPVGPHEIEFRVEDEYRVGEFVEKTRVFDCVKESVGIHGRSAAERGLLGMRRYRRAKRDRAFARSSIRKR